MNNAVKLVSVGCTFPRKVMTNQDFEKMVDTSDEWIVTRTGIKERRICEEEMNLELATKAAKNALEQASEKVPGFSIEKVGAVLVATSSYEDRLPAISCLLQRELGLPESIFAMDIGAACSGFVYGVYLAEALLKAKEMEYVLVVGSECLSKITDYTDRSTCILFGDGAGAALFSLTNHSVGFTGTVGTRGNDAILGCRRNEKIHMEGQEVFRFAVGAVGNVVEKLLRDSKITMDQIDYVVCHQANARIIEFLKKKYPGQEEKFYMNIERYGNTSAASIPIALWEMDQKGMLEKGMNILCIGFGGGLTWGGVLITV